MTDRGLPSADGSPACPFVAFEDDRDARADRPDHRHRCFAEAQPAPRALAHQEAYCLSSAFPVCPTFQDWARREAAHAIPGGARATTTERRSRCRHRRPRARRSRRRSRRRRRSLESAADRSRPSRSDPRRNPPRDWAAPPPWASSGAGMAAGAAASANGPCDHSAGPTAHPRRKGRDWPAAPQIDSPGARTSTWSGPRVRRRVHARRLTTHRRHRRDPDLAGLVGHAAYQAEASESHAEVRPPPTKAGRRPTVSSTRDKNRERERAAAAAAGAAAASQHEGPSWEKARRYEAYPSIKTRAGLSGMSGVPTIAMLAGGVVLAAVDPLLPAGRPRGRARTAGRAPRPA